MVPWVGVSDDQDVAMLTKYRPLHKPDTSYPYMPLAHAMVWRSDEVYKFSLEMVPNQSILNAIVLPNHTLLFPFPKLNFILKSFLSCEI